MGTHNDNTQSVSDNGTPVATEEKEKVGPGHPPKAHRFQKGGAGNPKGRPKNPWPAFMRDAMLDANGNDTGLTRGRALMMRMFGEAMGVHKCRNPDAIKEQILNYWLGKPVAPVELSGPDESPLKVDLTGMPPGSLEALNNAMIAAMKGTEE